MKIQPGLKFFYLNLVFTYNISLLKFYNAFLIHIQNTPLSKLFLYDSVGKFYKMKGNIWSTIPQTYVWHYRFGRYWSQKFWWSQLKKNSRIVVVQPAAQNTFCK